MTEPRQLATVKEYDALIEAMRGRLVELNITHATLDRITGLPGGYAGKVLGDARVRSLGPVSFGLLLQALGLKLAVLEDVEAVERMAIRWEERARPDYNANRIASVGKSTIRRMFPVIQAEIAKRASDARMVKMKPATRRRVARQAAKARWAKVKRKA